MRDDYKITKETQKLEIQVEKEIVQALEQMEANTKISKSELTNTALKRFIATHSDFMPRTKT